MVSLNKALLGPYFLGGVALGYLRFAWGYRVFGVTESKKPEGLRSTFFLSDLQLIEHVALIAHLAGGHQVAAPTASSTWPTKTPVFYKSISYYIEQFLDTKEHERMAKVLKYGWNTYI